MGTSAVDFAFVCFYLLLHASFLSCPPFPDRPKTTVLLSLYTELHGIHCFPFVLSVKRFFLM